MKPPTKLGPASRRQGFSLIELLIALVFISFLMAGMLRIYGSAIQGFSAANESVKAQRDNQDALDSLMDDVSQAGYHFPNTVAAVTFSVDTSSGQDPLMLLPSQTINVTLPDPSNPSSLLPVEKLTFDELQFLSDQPIDALAHLTTAASANGTSLAVEFTQGSFADVQAGDYVLMLDAVPGNTTGNYELVTIASSVPNSGTSGTIPLQGSSQNAATGVSFGSQGALFRNHPVNAEMVFIRPTQVIRYTLLALPLDPSNTAARIPCLVRDQAPYPSSGTRITWPAVGAALPTGYSRTVVAQNVTGLQFDMSLDQGKTWNKAATWPATATKLNSALTALAATNPSAGYAKAVDDPSQPLWFMNAPLLVRADITTRTILKRADYSATAGTSAYRTRTQTLFIQPRNFGLGI